MSENNEIVPGFDDERDDRLRINLQKIEEVENCLIFYLTGFTSIYNSNYFQNCVFKTIEAGYINLIFNLSGLDHISSSGIGAFLSFLKAVHACGGDLVLMEKQPEFYKVFKLLRYDQFFNFVDNLDEAVSFLKLEKKGQPILKIQVFGELELEDHINNKGSICSHCISIGDPGSVTPISIKFGFDDILALRFLDFESKEDILNNDEILVSMDDIVKVIDYYNSTKNNANGYTIHCWQGISRSTAIALGLLFMITKSETESVKMLREIRPNAQPNKLVLQYFDILFRSKLLDQYYRD